MALIYTASSFVKHFFQSTAANGVHSPFVFELMEDVFDPAHYYVFDDIEALRGVLKVSDKTILVQDLGEGSVFGKQNKRTVSAIARNALSPAEDLQMLYRLIKHLGYKSILELGTSLGISTAYLAAAASPGKVVTIEGCPNTAKIAALNWEKLGIANICNMVGPFDERLSEALSTLPQLDLVYLDGNHAYEPTLNYFNRCVEHTHENSVIVVDDIYWSKGMNRAWNEIKSDNRVTLTIDLFNLGLAFFRKKQPEQHFKIRRSVLK